MAYDTAQIHTVKEAPQGHFFEVAGTAIGTRSDLTVTLRVYTRELYILKNARMVARNAFVMNVVQHPQRFLIAKAREPLGDVEFEGKNIQLGVVHEESAMLMSRSEVEESLDQIARGPTADIEEELTMLTMKALSELLAAIPREGASGS